MSATSPLRDRLGVVSPAEAVSWLNLLIYGPPGVGKTYFLGTAQDHEDTSPMLLLDIEGGTKTLRKRKNLDVVRVHSIKQLSEDVFPMLKEDTSGYYKTVAIDSLSELQQLDMYDVLEARNDKRPDLRGEPASMREWGISSEHVRKFVRAFRDLPCNTIFTALDKTDKDESNRTSYMPALPGQLATGIPGFLDIVGYFTAKEEDGEIVRRLQTQKTQRVIAKDRTQALPPVIDAPTVPIMFEYINDSNED